VLYADTDRTDLELRLINLSLKHRLIDLTICVAALVTPDPCHRAGVRQSIGRSQH
jgi:hypothetical protein